MNENVSRGENLNLLVKASAPLQKVRAEGRTGLSQIAGYLLAPPEHPGPSTPLKQFYP